MGGMVGITQLKGLGHKIWFG